MAQDAARCPLPELGGGGKGVVDVSGWSPWHPAGLSWWHHLLALPGAVVAELCLLGTLPHGLDSFRPLPACGDLLGPPTRSGPEASLLSVRTERTWHVEA